MHRELRSFPTRRSSDLLGRVRGGGVLQPNHSPPPLSSPSTARRLTRHENFRHHRRHRRSEEHTSELQSRQYLVCRLLLEKKIRLIYIQILLDHLLEY